MQGAGSHEVDQQARDGCHVPIDRSIVLQGGLTATDLFGTHALITLAVNSSVGLPSAAGTNTGDMGGNLKISSANNVRNNRGS